MRLGDKEIGDGHPCYVVAEIGINHNGSLDLARALIDAAADAGADAVKLQKRDIEAVYSAADLDKPREHPFGGPQTNRRQKEALEFSWHQHDELSCYAASRGLDYGLSFWDPGSVRVGAEFLGLPWVKVASCHVANRDEALVEACVATGLPLLASTGACADEDVRWLLTAAAGRQLALLHCVSTYPCEDRDVNLAAIVTMRRAYGLPTGYSGHERGVALSVCAVALGACVIERHLTLDRSMYGSDQAASLEPAGFRRMVRDIRAFEAARGDGVKRRLHAEEAIMAKLRRAGA